MKSPHLRAAIGALLIGVGCALVLSARASVPCADCEDEPEATITDVAAASAEMNGQGVPVE